MPKIAIFDFDNTLVHEGFEPPIECPEAFDVIKFLHKKNFIICIASFNKYAKELCLQTSFCDYIDLIIGLNTQDKKDYHFKTILEYFECKPTDCIFFDDIKENVVYAKKLGMKAKLVNWKKGVTMSNIRAMKI